MIVGTFGYAAGASGTVELPATATILGIWALGGANATVEIGDGDAIPLPANAVFNVSFNEGGAPPGGTTIAFTDTTSYYVTYITALS